MSERRTNIHPQPQLSTIWRKIILSRMRRLPLPRSRVFRSLLILALLAWTAFSFESLAHPLAMIGEVSANTLMATTEAAPSHCDGSATTHTSHAAHPAPSHPAGNGHGCCVNGNCYCASLCSGIASGACLDMAWQAPHGAVLIPVHAAPTLIQAAPPLRPPIA